MTLSDFKALIPRWVFFDGFGAACRIEVRFGKSLETLGPWLEVFRPRDRKAWQLFHNPRANLRLFAVSSFERFITEAQEHIGDPSVLSNAESYRVCKALLREESSLPSSGYYQFKVKAVLEREEAAGLQDAFVSPVEKI